MDLGITCIKVCVTQTAITYIHLLFCIGMLADKLNDMMQHPHPTQFPVWLRNGMWTMAKNYRTKFHNLILLYYNKLGSGQTCHDAEENTVKAYFFEYATKSNAAEEKKVNQGRLDVHMPNSNFLHMHFWSMYDRILVQGNMNVTRLIFFAGSVIFPPTVAQHQHLSRTDTRALAKAKLNPQTFTVIDTANKAKITKQGTRTAT
jgi:hypothetical protein